MSWRPFLLPSLALALTVGGVAACQGEEEPVPPATSHDRDIQPIWNAKCEGCHVGGVAFAGLWLDEPMGYEHLVGVPASQLPTMARVEPGDPQASYLWRKLQGTHVEVGGYGEKVPVVLTEEEEALIELWIEEGAPP